MKAYIYPANEAGSPDASTPVQTDAEEESEKEEEKIEPKKKRAKLAKNTTMLATLKVRIITKIPLDPFFKISLILQDSEHLLKDTNIQEDAKTRRQSERINNLLKKKPKLSKHSTMLATAKVFTFFNLRLTKLSM